VEVECHGQLPPGAIVREPDTIEGVGKHLAKRGDGEGADEAARAAGTARLRPPPHAGVTRGAHGAAGAPAVDQAHGVPRTSQGGAGALSRQAQRTHGAKKLKRHVIFSDRKACICDILVDISSRVELNF
jgi:hypothetical protein